MLNGEPLIHDHHFEQLLAGLKRETTEFPDLVRVLKIYGTT